MFTSIVWASDGSENADRALEYARELAAADSGRIVAVHVKEMTTGRSAGYPVQLDEGDVERKVKNQADELTKGRRKLTLRFDLPRGSYATMLVKRVSSC